MLNPSARRHAWHLAMGLLAIVVALSLWTIATSHASPANAATAAPARPSCRAASWQLSAGDIVAYAPASVDREYGYRPCALLMIGGTDGNSGDVQLITARGAHLVDSTDDPWQERYETDIASGRAFSAAGRRYYCRPA